MRIKPWIAWLTLACIGCSKDAPAPSGPVLAESYWLASAPDDAIEVLDARGLAALPDAMSVRGRVGDFVASRAQFKLVDASFRPCDENPDDSCPTPWDYCCIAPDEIASGTIVVEFRDGDRLVKAGLEGFHGFTHLSPVTVRGTPSRDEAGNLTIAASGIHVEPRESAR